MILCNSKFLILFWRLSKSSIEETIGTLWILLPMPDFFVPTIPMTLYGEFFSILVNLMKFSDVSLSPTTNTGIFDFFFINLSFRTL